MILANFITDFFKWLNRPWMPEDAGGFADNVDALNGGILFVSYFFVALIGGLMIVFAIKYRQTDKREVGEGATHSTPIEIAWTLPPLVIVLIIFAVGFTGFLDMSTPPKAGNAYEIRAQAYKWGWNFYYPNGGQSDKLYVPADRPVRLTLESNDVLHSLFVPAMRAKKDVVPGRFNEMWFEPDPSLVSAEQPMITLMLHCTEYCGQGHSQMNTDCIVVHESKWDEVLAEVKKFNPDGLPPAEYGKTVWEQRGGCKQCHSIDESMAVVQGPPWYNLYGSERQLTSGETVTADDNYMLESIRHPNAKMAVGFAAGGMSAYPETQLSAGDVRALIEFMKSISPEHYPQGADLEQFPEEYEGKEDVTPGNAPDPGNENAAGGGEAESGNGEPQETTATD